MRLCALILVVKAFFVLVAVGAESGAATGAAAEGERADDETSISSLVKIVAARDSRIAELESELADFRSREHATQRRLASSQLRGADEKKTLVGETLVDDVEKAVTGEEERIALADAKEELVPVGSPAFIQDVALAALCVTVAALAAGLTMGMVSLDPMEMDIICRSEEKDKMSDKDKKKLREEKIAALKVLPLITDHHRLLVTLLLMNSVANEALPLFLDAIVPSWAAVLISVSLVLVFGEIIPSAIFTGSQQLRIAARFSGIVGCARFLLAPIAWPMAKTLDCLLGHNHKGRYNFAELRAIVGIHNRAGLDDKGEAVFASCDGEGYGIITTEQVHHFCEDSIVEFSSKPNVPAVSKKLLSDKTPYFVAPCPPMRGRDLQTTFKLHTSEERNADDLIRLSKGDIESGVFKTIERDELKIMHGVMQLTHMEAVKAMTSMRKVNMLESSESLTLDKLKHIYNQGHSRLPVYDGHRHNLRGFVLTKSLITVSPSPDDEKLGKVTRVNDLKLQKFVVIEPTIAMLDLLNRFQEKKCHMALIVNDPAAVQEAWEKETEIPADVHMMGIVTMEDVIEQMLQEEIEDENDDMRPESSQPVIPRTQSVLAKADKLGVAMRLEKSLSRSDIPVVPSDSPVSPPPKSRTGSDLAQPLLEKAPLVASGGDKISAINNRAGEAKFSYRQ